MAQLSSRLYRSSFGVLVLILVVTLGAALYDILQQIVSRESDTRVTQAADFIISAGTYVVIGIFAFFITLSRLWTHKTRKAKIPRAYVPVNEGDVPSAVSSMINLEYARCAIIAQECQPKPRELEGLGNPGTIWEFQNKRQKILEASALLDRLLEPLLPQNADKWTSPHRSPFQRYACLFLPKNNTPPTIPRSLLVGLQAISDIIIKARYAKDEPSQEDLDNSYKICAVLASAVKRVQPVEVPVFSETSKESLSDDSSEVSVGP